MFKYALVYNDARLGHVMANFCAIDAEDLATKFFSIYHHANYHIIYKTDEA